MQKEYSLVIAIVLAIILVGCAVVYAAPTKTPYISSLSQTAFIGGQPYSVDAYGSGFTNKSVVYFNDSPCATVFLSPSHLQFTISAAQLNNLSGTFQIYVFNPAK